MSFYTDYYKNIIQHQQGFKLVLGGTGLGKTSGIIETVKQNTEGNKRFFYVANRLQLLNELKTNLEKGNIGYCLQESDEEIIKKIKKDDFETLLNDDIIKKYVNKLYKGNSTFIKQNYSLIQEFAKKENTNFSNLSDVTDFLRGKVTNIFSFFRNIIKQAGKEKNRKDYETLISNPTTKILFPYLDFKNNPIEKRIFLVTIQKAFYGFFDGEKVINIYKLENDKKKEEQNIVFLDEFDFLENDLLSQICKDTVIEQPFTFVENFYNNLTKYKLPRLKFLETNTKFNTDLRTELQSIIELIEPLNEKYNIPFPEINHFLSTENDLRGTAIFQTRYSISGKPIYLNYQRLDEKGEKIKAFYLELATEQNKPNTFTLLDVVNKATSAIIRIFKELEFTEPEIYRALVEQCFGSSDKYKRILKIIRQHPYRRKSVSTNESKMYYNGFGLYEIYNFRYPTDMEEVELKYYSIFSTPESILLHLTKNNLVFGLSATAEINRYVKNFDLNWLKSELGVLYYEIENSDKELIKKANTIKQFGNEKISGRNNIVKIEIAKEIITNALDDLINNVVHTNKEIFGERNKEKYRKKRLVHFFATLQWVAENKEINNTNLLFFSSYKHILHIFEKVREPESDIYYIQEIDNELKNCYQITFQERKFIVLFFDANQGKEIAKLEENKQAYYDLFLQNKTVLVITTYPSAGNGVNLFYYSDAEKTDKSKKDFANIHLLDSPFYFFNPIDNENDTEQEKTEKIKSNIYYLAKLEKNKIITENHFKAYLNNIRGISSFNNFYLNTDDGLCSRVATYIQALGRVERVWEKMDNQVIRLDREVYNHLETFATENENYLQFLNFERNKPYFSQNVSAMFDYIIENKPNRKQQQRHKQWEGLQNINNKCITSIESLLSKLNSVRNTISQERALEIRREWYDLREYALKQSFAKKGEFENEKGVKISFETSETKLFKKYNATFETDLYDHKNKCLWVQKDTLNVVPAEINPDSSFYAWELDSAFQNIRNNFILKGYFDLHRYEQGFAGKGTYFTPYFYQCILVGAIGEEVVKAIFEYEKVVLEDKEIDNTLFELIDLKVKNKAWYIDAKNYSEQTITNFQLNENDSKLDAEAFKQKAQEKLAKIANFHTDTKDCKIIYINAFGSGERPTNYYDENFNDVDTNFEKAKIIIVQSMLKKEKAEKDDKNYTNDFTHFIFQLKKQLNNG